MQRCREDTRLNTLVISLIVDEQHVELALRVADHTCVMNRDTVGPDGSSAEIREDPDLVHYLAPQDCHTAVRKDHGRRKLRAA
ncbi:MAG: hypothetical protein OXE86_18505 [Alphaproteobacteria bacterium]|nr:hypothetical protein [Alphaproteobacteria bacterium]